MKTKLQLLLMLLMTCQLANAQFYLSEIMVDPPGTDAPNEYIEIRGTANASLTNVYLLTIEGDGNDPGDVNEVIDLTGQTIGSNGYLVLLTTGNAYQAASLVNPAANVALDIKPADLESQSHTFLLIQTTTPPSDSDDIDSDNDGIPDGSPYNTWTILDAISLLKDNDSSAQAYCYSSIGFLENDLAQTPPTVFPSSGVLVISTGGTQFDYVARIGNSTGSALTNDETTSDWVGGDLPSGNLPNWYMGSTSTAGQIRAYPESFEGSQLNHIGSPNPSQNTTLTVNEFNLSSVKVYPNPTKNILNIESNSFEVSSVEIHDVLGKRVLQQNGLNNNQIDISNLTNGIYIMKINADGKTLTRKIIKE